MNINLIIPTFKKEEYTIKCLKSIKDTEDPKFNLNIIWVDNNSGIDSRRKVRNFLTDNDMTFDSIFLSENLGFIKAVNIGLKFIKEKYPKNKYVGILNNDVIFFKDWLKNLVDALEKNDKLMCAGSVCFNENNIIDYRDLMFFEDFKNLNILKTDSFDEVFKKMTSIKPAIKIFNKDDYENILESKTYVPYFSVVFKSKIFDELGYLDESFGLGYVDDLEYNYRICKAGYEIAKVNNSIAFHYHHLSFNDVVRKENIRDINNSHLQIFFIKNSLNTNHEKQGVIYTCITNEYDDLCELKEYDDSFDYICFTNNEKLLSAKINPWKIIDIRMIAKELSNHEDKNRIISRFFKTHPHYFFKNYDKSIWVDGNVIFSKNIKELADMLDDENYLLCFDHPLRTNIYQEIIACHDLNKDSDENLNKIKNYLISEKFPNDFNYLTQTSVLIRRHNNDECVLIMEKWWYFILNYSKRDQLSFNFIFWKYGGKYLSLPWKYLKYFSVLLKYKHKNHFI